jgi:RNA polymerase sigma factor (sigma-70 family)
MPMHHHNRDYIAAVERERRARRLDGVVRAAAAGDDSAWSAIVEQFASRIRYAARTRWLAAHDAEDVEQDTWMSLFKHIDSIREPAALGAWLETTAVRASLDTIRRSERETPTDNPLQDDPEFESVAEQNLIAQERRNAVAAAITRLPQHQRELLTVLMEAPGASYADVAAHLTIPIGSIGPTRARALVRLRDDNVLAEVISD